MPQSAAGSRIEPPVSVPSAPGVSPAATAAPDPLEEPPVKWPVFHGLRAGGQARSNEGPPWRELVRRQLAEQHAAGLVQARDGGGVLRRHGVGTDAGMAGGADSRRC